MRSKRAKIQAITPDAKYGSTLIAKLINRAMKDGKKSVAQKQVYNALDIASKKSGMKPLELLDAVLESVTPQMEVRSRRVGGAAYQIPMPIRGRRGTSLAVRWLVQESNKRPNKQYHTYADKLAAEMLDSLEGQSGTVNKKNSSHKMAEANKAFSHFRW
jgi:small subunit ribosomal protein S7